MVAGSVEVKALVILMGVPWFKIGEEAKRYGIVAFSSNYALYADMSNRIVRVLERFSPNLDVYSIDESFLALDGFPPATFEAHARELRGARGPVPRFRRMSRHRAIQDLSQACQSLREEKPGRQRRRLLLQADVGKRVSRPVPAGRGI